MIEAPATAGASSRSSPQAGRLSGAHPAATDRSVIDGPTLDVGDLGGRLTGAFDGTTVSGGAGTPVGSGLVGTSIHVFTGTIEGCGEGSVVILETIASVDAVTSTGTWQLVDGSGTGGLDVQGDGTFTAVQRPDGSGTSNSVGRIRC